MKNYTKFTTVAVALLTGIAANAQTGSTVREGVVWNYALTHEMYTGDVLDRTTDYGYHFDGSKEIDGKTYMRFVDGDGVEVALMRQEGKKVYTYVDYEVHFPIEDAVLEAPGDMLLYDFDAEIGDTCNILCYDEPALEGWAQMYTFDVVDRYSVSVGGKESTVLILGNVPDDRGPSIIRDSEFSLIEGVGISDGILCFPQLVWMKTGGSRQLATLESLTDTDGNVIFSGGDFPTFGMITRDDVFWDYEVTVYDESGVIKDISVDPGYHFCGTREEDGKRYRRLLDGNDAEVALMREEWVMREKAYLDVYLHIDRQTAQTLYPDAEKLPMEVTLYELYAQDTSYKSLRYDYSSNPMPVATDITVTKLETVFHDEESYPASNVSVNGFDGYKYAGLAGTSCGWLHKPQWGEEVPESSAVIAKLKCVRDRHGKELFKYKDFGIDVAVKTVNADNISVRTENGVIRVTGLTDIENVSLYDISGRLAAIATAVDGTATLKPQTPGLYLIRVGNRTFKCVVR